MSLWAHGGLRGLAGVLVCAVALAGAHAAEPAGAAGAEPVADAVSRTGILKVAVYNDYFPFSEAKEGGIDVEIAQALADSMGVKLSLLPFDAGESVNDDLRNMVWKGHYLGYGPADVMMHVPYDHVLAQQNDKVTIFAPYHLESVTLAINDERLPDWQGFDVFTHERIAVDGGSFSAQIMLGMDGGKYREHVAMGKNIHAALDEFASGRAAAIMGMRSELEAGGAAKLPNRLVDFSVPGAPRRSWAVGMSVKVERTELALSLIHI